MLKFQLFEPILFYIQLHRLSKFSRSLITMKNRYIIAIFCNFLLCLGIVFPAYSLDMPEKDNPKKVLVLHSYHQGYEWVSTISRGIKRVFEGAKDIQVETYYMDTKRKTSLDWKMESGRRAREVISQWDPDVVITVDDNAQEYVGKFYAGLKRPKIVFCGVNNKAEKYGYPASNITGILERPHIKDTLDLLGQVVPELKRAAVISDNSPTSCGTVEYIKRQARTLDNVSLTYDMPVTFAQWKSRTISLNPRSEALLIYMYHVLKQEGHVESMPSREVMEWTVANSIIPVAGFFPFSIDDGALLGVVESGLEHGREASIIAMGLLNGKELRQFPIKTAKKGLAMFNKQTAYMMGIPLDEELRKRIDIIVGE